MKKLWPLLQLQHTRSRIPTVHELLIEQFKARDGYHIFIFPFEGRLVHEGMATVIAYRISQVLAITFSISMNDYGFELLSDQYVDMQEVLKTTDLFDAKNLVEDIHKSINANEMAKRRFREIATISGLLFQGFPGKHIKTRQLQSSSALLFDVISEYEKDNLFIQQAYREVLEYQLGETRLRKALTRIKSQKIIVQKTDKPSPLAFPLIVDRMREQLSSEKLEDRIQKMIKIYGDGA